MVCMRKSVIRHLVLGVGVLGGCGLLAACGLGTSGTLSVADAMADAETVDALEDATAVDGSADRTIPADVVTPSEAATDAPAEAEVADAESDGPGCTPLNCGGACCGNRCVSRTCAECEIGTLFCPYSTTVLGSNGQCVASCSSCNSGGTPLPVGCFSCASSSPVGACAANVSACPADVDSGACACSFGADAGTGVDAGDAGHSADAGDGGDAGSAGNPGSCPGSTQICRGHACVTCGQGGTQGLSCGSGQACNQSNAACAM